MSVEQDYTIISFRLKNTDPEVQRILALMAAEGNRTAVFREATLAPARSAGVRLYLAWYDGELADFDTTKPIAAPEPDDDVADFLGL